MMIVTCGQCAASFKIDPAKIKESGSRVRCSNCQSVFTIYRPQNIAPAEATAMPAQSPPKPPPHSTATPAGFDLNKFLSDLETQPAPEFGEVVERLEKQADSTEFFLEETEKNFALSYSAPESEATGLVERRPSRYDNFEEDESFDFAAQPESSTEDASATKPVKVKAETGYGEDFSTEETTAYQTKITSPESTQTPAPPSRRRRKQARQDDFDLGLEQNISESALAGDLAQREHVLDEPDDFDTDLGDDIIIVEQAEPQLEEEALEKLVRANVPPTETDDLGLGDEVSDVQPGRLAQTPPRRESPAVRLKKGLAPIWLIMGFGLVVLLALGWFGLRQDNAAVTPDDNPDTEIETPVAEVQEAPLDDGNSLELPSSIAYDAAADRGGLKIRQKDSKPFLRTNKKAGQILIITGRAENNYPESRSFIQVKASLKDHAGNILSERLSYCGNILTENELIELPINEILARLVIKAGRNNANINLPPGQSVPFMLVFDNVPDSLDSYAVETLSSSPQEH